MSQIDAPIHSYKMVILKEKQTSKINLKHFSTTNRAPYDNLDFDSERSKKGLFNKVFFSTPCSNFRVLVLALVFFSEGAKGCLPPTVDYLEQFCAILKVPMVLIKESTS